MTDELKATQAAAYQAFLDRLEPGLAGFEQQFIFDAGWRAGRQSATSDALTAMREAREALGYCEFEAYSSVDADGSVDRYGYGRIEKRAKAALANLTTAIEQIEGKQP
jgi:hypothetical protein